MQKLVKREAIDLREMIEYMKTLPSSTFRKSIIGYLKRQLESLNTSGPIISFNMHKDEFLLYQKFVLLTLKERESIKEGKLEQTKEAGESGDSIPQEKKQVIIPTKIIQ